MAALLTCDLPGRRRNSSTGQSGGSELDMCRTDRPASVFVSFLPLRVCRRHRLYVCARVCVDVQKRLIVPLLGSKAAAHFPASAIWKELVAPGVRWRGNQRLDEWKTVCVWEGGGGRVVNDGVCKAKVQGGGVMRGLPSALGTPSVRCKGIPLNVGGRSQPGGKSRQE